MYFLIGHYTIGDDMIKCQYLVKLLPKKKKGPPYRVCGRKAKSGYWTGSFWDLCKTHFIKLGNDIRMWDNTNI